MGRSRRSKFAIDFNQAPEVVVRLVVADLLRKHPRGANGKLSKSDYDWGRNPTTCNSNSARRENVGIYCGYTEDQLFDLFVKEDGVGRYRLNKILEHIWLREQYPGKTDAEYDDMYYYVPEATMTRRKNRIEDRIHYVRRRIKEQGRTGIYKINTQWRTAFHDVPFYVWANTRIEAEGQFNTLTKPLIAAVDPKFTLGDGVGIEQTQFDVEPSELLEATQLTINAMDKKEKDLEKTIEELKAQLEGLRGIKTMVTDMAVQSITLIDS